MTQPPPDRTPSTIHVALQHMRSSLCGRIRTMLADSDAGFIHQFPQLVAGIETRFRQEEAILEQRDAARLHARRESNATVLRALHRVAPLVELGDANLGRQVAEALHAILATPTLAGDLAPASAVLPASADWRPDARRATRPGWPRQARTRH